VSVVIDLVSRREVRASGAWLFHPAGVRLPIDAPADADLIPPGVRAQIATGAFSAEIIDRLAEAIRPGDRVLVVGAGLGIVSTLVARRRAARVISVEADVTRARYLERVHALNGVPWVETVNGVLSNGRRGCVPFFARPDVRASSLLPDGDDWSHVMMVPLVELNLIVAEEDINVVVCEDCPDRVCLSGEDSPQVSAGIVRLRSRRSMTGT